MSDDTSGSDFDDEEDPDKIEVPGKSQIYFVDDVYILLKLNKIFIYKKSHFTQDDAIIFQ